MRKKTKQSVDVASVVDAWQALFDSNKVISREQLSKDGWIDAIYAAKKMGIGRAAATERLKKLGIQQKKFCVMWEDGRNRLMNFFKMK